MPSTLPLVYPVDLPCPSSAGLTWAERRELSDLPGPETRRAVFTDRLGTQDLFIFFRTFAQLTAWRAFYGLVRGNWFAAEWPRPDGGTSVVRILGGLQYTGFMPEQRGWGVAFSAQIRGRGELPVLALSNCTDAIAVAEVADEETLLIATWIGSDPVIPPVTQQTYVNKIRTPGGAYPLATFRCDFTIAWDDLDTIESGTVDLFNCDRDGTGSQHLYADITITDIPTNGVAECKVVVFQSTGHWTSAGTVPNGFVSVNGNNVGYPDYTPNVGDGVLAAQIILRNNHGALTATLA